MRRLDSLAAIVILAGGIIAGLLALVVANARPVARSLAGIVPAAGQRFVDVCVSLFSLGPLQPALILIWFLILGLLLWISVRLARELAHRYICTRRQIAGLCLSRIATLPMELARQCDALGFDGRVDLVDFPAALALCYGLRRPRVLVSTGLLAQLSAAELRAVLLHERLHLHRRDPLRLLLAQSFAAAFAPIGLVRALAIRLAVEQEVAADRAAVRAQGGASDLASAMLRLVDADLNLQNLQDLAVTGLSATAVRVEALTDPAAARALLAVDPRQFRLGLVSLLATGIGGIAFTAAVQAGHVVHHCPAIGLAIFRCLS